MDKCLVITGGSRGIGERTIELFVKNKWRVINLSRTPCRIQDVINLSVDLTTASLSVEQTQLLTMHLSQAKQISLVHNAAKFDADNVKTLTAENLQTVLNINIVAAVTLNTLCIPFMKPGSSIIYIGSTLSEQAVANRASYVISKHALIGLMRATCQDLAAERIHTCCICPGFVNTTMLTGAVDASVLEAFIPQKVILGRLIEPEEIADLIAYCTDHPLINGSILHANLGQTMS